METLQNPNHLQIHSNPTVLHVNGDCSLTSSASMSEKKSTEASKNHKEAERRRRQRINDHLSTLRTLLPNTTKTDKASLLAEVVHHVRELKKHLNDATAARHDGDDSGSESVVKPSLGWPFPGEADEASLSYWDVEEERVVKATVCCEERPGLNRDLSQAIRSVEARMVRAEMVTVGGRTKNVVVMQWAGHGDEKIRELKRALSDVVKPKNKRVRVYRSVSEKKPRTMPFGF